MNNCGCLFSSCFFNDNDNIYVLTSKNRNTSLCECENIKVFDMNKNKIKEINNSNEDTVYIDNYYDSKNNKNLIVTCNIGHINIFDFKNNSLFKKYNDSNFCGRINDFVVDERGNIKQLLGSFFTSINIWDFYTGDLLKRIKPDLNGINVLCLFDKNYILAGASEKGNNNKLIILIDLTNEKIVNKINTKQEKEISRIKCIDTKNGKIFISGGRWSDKQLEFSIQFRIEINNFYG